MVLCAAMFCSSNVHWRLCLCAVMFCSTNVIETLVKVDGKRSKEFEVKVEVHHGFVLSSLLFAAVNEATKDVREVVCEVLYAMIRLYLEIAAKK